MIRVPRVGAPARAAVRAAVLGAVLVAVLLGTTGCGSGAGDAAGRPDGDRTLTVLAAASLTEPFETLADAFEHQHPDVRVRLSFDSSATLAEQVAQGAPADVLATADEATMQRVVDAGAARGSPRAFASNTIVLAVPADNPAGITAFSDLDDPEVSFVACVQTAPCGAIARQALARNHVDAHPRSLEVDVKAVLAKVRLGEADAGLVYASDAVAAGHQVDSLPVPHADELRNDYPIAALRGTAEPGLADAWVRLVLSGQGRRVLTRDGFRAP